MADGSEDDGEGPPPAPHVSWAQNSSCIATEEDSNAPLPAEGRVVFVTLGDVASGDVLEARVKKTWSSNSGNSFSTFMASPTPMIRSLAVPMAPRVLGNSQRENCPRGVPEEPTATSYMGLLTPPRSFDHRRTSGGPDDFERVPDEVLLHIFTFLTRRNVVKCMRVCKKWNRIGLDESLWRRIDLSFKTVQIRTIKHLFNRGTSHLRMAKCNVKGSVFQDLSVSFSEEQRLSRLQYLDLSMAVVSDALLTDILAQCRQLKKVSLETVTVSDTVLHMLSESTQLDTLNLAMCRGITSSGLMPLFAHCAQLTCLNLAWTHMDSRCVSYVCGAVPDSIQRLNISGFRQAITDADIARLAQRCRSLLELDLSDSVGLNEGTVEALVLHLKTSLQELSLNRCYNIPYVQLKDLGQITSLHTLNIIGRLPRPELVQLKEDLGKVRLNVTFISSIARPTTGFRRTSIWEERVREI
ncbi:hypothetical protein ACOMHN_054100 [Nucella lapillus]